jgi:hypothetical protein
MNIIVYDIDMTLEAIMRWQECSPDDALEWFHYNPQGSWFGEGTPTFYSDDYDEENE